MKKTLCMAVILFISLISMAQDLKKETEKIVKSATDENGITLRVELEKKVFDPRAKINMKMTIVNNADREILLMAPKKELYKYMFVLMQMKNKSLKTETPVTLYGHERQGLSIFDAAGFIKTKEEYSLIYELDRVFDLSLESEYSLNLRLPYFINKSHEILKLENIEFEIKEKITQKTVEQKK